MGIRKKYLIFKKKENSNVVNNDISENNNVIEDFADDKEEKPKKKGFFSLPFLKKSDKKKKNSKQNKQSAKQTVKVVKENPKKDSVDNQKKSGGFSLKKLFLMIGLLVFLFLAGVFVFAYMSAQNGNNGAYSKIKQRAQPQPVKSQTKKNDKQNVTGYGNIKTPQNNNVNFSYQVPVDKEKNSYPVKSAEPTDKKQNINKKTENLSVQPETDIALKIKEKPKKKNYQTTKKEEVEKTVLSKPKPKKIRYGYKCEALVNDELLYYVKKEGKLMPAYEIPNWDGKGIKIKKGDMFVADDILNFNDMSFIKYKDNIFLPINDSIKCKKGEL